MNEDLKSSGDRLFTDEDLRNINPIVQQCNEIFRHIADPFVRMGRVVGSDAIHRHQRRTQSGSITVIPDYTLAFEFTIVGRLIWQCKSREILQSVADLNQLKVSLMLMIDVAEVARQSRRRDKKTGRAAWK